MIDLSRILDSLRTFSRYRWVRRIIKVLPLAAVLMVLLTSLYLVVNVEQETSQLSRHALWILVSALLALMFLVIIIVGRLIRLRARVKANEPGAKLTQRLVKIFSALALPPVFVLYVFSLQFLSETVEGWLDVQTEQALAQSIELGQLFMALRTRAVRSDLARVADTIELNDGDVYAQLLNYVSVSGPTELTVLDASGQPDVSVNIDPSEVVANLPNPFALSQALENGEYAAAEPSADGLVIRIIERMSPMELGGEAFLLQAIYPLPSEFSSLAGNIEEAYYRYQNVAFLRVRLEQSLVLILSLVLLLTALLAILLAFNAARRVSQPVRDLALATQELAAGRFPEKLPVEKQDELGFLVRSFNTMTDELAQSRQALEAQRRYLETVLSRLSSGVIAVDAKGQLSALNASAARILGLSEDHDLGRSLDHLGQDHPAISNFLALIRERLGTEGGEWRQEIQLLGDFSGSSTQGSQPVVLVCRGSDLPGELGGHVVVFDDVTVLDQAQREAAWAEVARRLAHEVKNPLTPIQLAAERLDYKLSGSLSDEHADLLKRATTTIGAQVEALRRLVDAFGDYARPKPPRFESMDLAQAVHEVIDLYTSADHNTQFEVTIEGSTEVQADPGRIRQILINLITNAQEAQPNGPCIIDIHLSPSTRLGGSVAVLVSDHGPGFDVDIEARAFEPYVSTKPGGSGLGLAIVRKMVEEHGGAIELMTTSERGSTGAQIQIWLPIHSVTQ